MISSLSLFMVFKNVLKIWWLFYWFRIVLLIFMSVWEVLQLFWRYFTFDTLRYYFAEISLFLEMTKGNDVIAYFKTFFFFEELSSIFILALFFLTSFQFLGDWKIQVLVEKDCFISQRENERAYLPATKNENNLLQPKNFLNFSSRVHKKWQILRKLCQYWEAFFEYIKNLYQLSDF